jgi:type II secretion system protein N
VAAAAKDTAEFTIPRPLMKVGVPFVGLMLVLFFLVRGFPYDQLADRITLGAEQGFGVQLEIDQLGPAFQLAGPALELRGAHVRFPGGTAFPIDRVLIRPAWSLSWFSGTPAFYAEADSTAGSAQGIFQLADSSSWTGSVQNVSLVDKALASVLPTRSFTGSLDADFDLEFGEQGPEGRIDLEIRDGSVTLPKIPIGLPFDRLTSELTLGGDAFLTIESFEFEGSGTQGSGSGEIAHSSQLENARLNIEVNLSVSPDMSKLVHKAGLRADREGKIKARISGTVAKPTIR